ncbi:AraC family transcriptional regulator [Thiohalophilus sp.]|uniref:AraC family transcriptional regulator n=1 Tax=Thiohalophilus sp. TaxID=3028392 RepID=UPI002ACD48E7|nr:AraC family transcriptional regulator [Thiohalophilus sp.]MDZ7805288.1 AraC family transcriptional regulator [Thiohalophilus sp.]
MDALSEILHATRLNARVFLHSRFCGQWAVDTSGTRQATFHVVARGNAWLHRPDRTHPEPLRGGDLVVFPHDAAHVISNSDTPPGPAVPRNQPAPAGSEGSSTSLICGYFEFGEQRWNALLESMPDYLVIRNEQMGGTGHMSSLIDFMIAEAETGQQGADAVINRLSDTLFIQVVRSYVAQVRPARGLVAALADTRLARGLNAFHQQPAANWSVATLARQAGMSRSAFAARFQQIIGQTPLHYITQWRMHRAYDLLATTDYSTRRVAEQCGYQNEAAFAKAFKRQFELGPGAVRRQSRFHQ